MKLKKTTFIMCIVLTTILSVSITYAYTYHLFMLSKHETQTKVNLRYVFELYDGVFVYDIHNVITNIGENHTRNAFSRGNEENVTKLAVGNVSGTLQTKTALDSVYNDPTDGQYPEATIVEWMYSGDSAYNATFQWTFEETINLNGASLYVGNTTFSYAIANFSEGAQTFSNGENLTVRWTPVYNAND